MLVGPHTPADTFALQVESIRLRKKSWKKRQRDDKNQRTQEPAIR